jgi:hypothetical protein
MRYSGLWYRMCNAGNHLQDSTAAQPRKPQLTPSPPSKLQISLSEGTLPSCGTIKYFQDLAALRRSQYKDALHRTQQGLHWPADSCSVLPLLWRNPTVHRKALSWTYHNLFYEDPFQYYRHRHSSPPAKTSYLSVACACYMLYPLYLLQCRWANRFIICDASLSTFFFNTNSPGMWWFVKKLIFPNSSCFIV